MKSNQSFSGWFASISYHPINAFFGISSHMQHFTHMSAHHYIFDSLKIYGFHVIYISMYKHCYKPDVIREGLQGLREISGLERAINLHSGTLNPPHSLRCLDIPNFLHN